MYLTTPKHKLPLTPHPVDYFKDVLSTLEASQNAGCTLTVQNGIFYVTTQDDFVFVLSHEPSLSSPGTLQKLKEYLMGRSNP
jgi:hypothetical protein